MDKAIASTTPYRSAPVGRERPGAMAEREITTPLAWPSLTLRPEA